MSGANSLDVNKLTNAPEHTVAAEIVSQWTLWRGQSDIARKRWKEAVQYAYATSTTETTNADNGHGHSTHIPKTANILDNLNANYMEALFPHNDWFKFKGFDQESTFADKRSAIESYLKTKHDLSGFTNTIQRIIADWCLYGNCFAGVTYERELHNTVANGAAGFQGPRVYRISPYDIVFNPMATDFEHAPKIIRSLKTMGELLRDVEENPELGYSQDIIDLMLNDRKMLQSMSATDVDKNEQMRFDGFGSVSQYYNSGHVEILEFYGDIYDKTSQKLLKNHVVTVVDRKYIVRSQPLETWTGRPHIYHCGWRTRPDNLWAMGPVDNLIGLQYRMNHLENSRADAFDAMLSPDLVFSGPVEDVDTVNGATHYIMAEGGSVRNLAPDTTVLNADFQIQQIEAQMELYAGAPREAMGVRTPGEKTAAEVATLEAASGRIFQHKIRYFEREFLEKILEAEVEVARRNIDTIDVIEILDDDIGVSEFVTIQKSDITANGRLNAIGARHFARQNQLAKNLQQFSQNINSDPLLQQHFPSERLAKAWEDLLGFKNLELLQPYGRVAETAELERLSQVAQSQVQEEAMTSANEEGFEDDEIALPAEEPAF
jgi:hypothetical protein